jgi:light-regulated signal transduction histidine kinase (bacteriophytochrome)
MRAMINGMLNLSRAGKVIGEFREVDLEALVAVIKTDLRELIRSKNAEVRISGRLPTVWGDQDRMGQLLANLIANGLKYNQSRNPWVEIAAAESAGDRPVGVKRGVDSGEEATISVKDNGIGIEPQFHGTIFQLFRRLHTQDEYEGTGAGLAICNKIAQAHGGKIWVESIPGQGATFYVRVPLCSPSGARARVSSLPSESSVSEALADERSAI